MEEDEVRTASPLSNGAGFERRLTLANQIKTSVPILQYKKQENTQPPHGEEVGYERIQTNKTPIVTMTQTEKPIAVPVTAPRISNQAQKPLQGVQTGALGVGSGNYGANIKNAVKDDVMGTALKTAERKYTTEPSVAIQTAKPASVPVTAPRINNQRISLVKGVRTGALGVGSGIYNTVKKEVGKDGSMGGAMVSGGMTAIEGGYTALKLGQTITNVAIGTPGVVSAAAHGVTKVGKGTVDVAVTMGRLTITAVQTASWVMKNCYIPFRPGLTKQVFQLYANRTSLIHTATYKNITAATKTTLRRIRETSAKKIAAVGRGATGAVKTAVVQGVPKAAKIMGGLTLNTANALMASNDPSVQGAGAAMTAITYGAKTTVTVGVAATKTAGKTIHTVGRVGRTTVRGIRYVSKHGWKAAWRRVGRGAKTATAGAAKGVGNALVNGIKAMGKKMLIPAIAAIAVVLLMSVAGIAGGGGGAMGGTVFGGVFLMVKEDGTIIPMNVRDYVLDAEFGIPVMRAEYVEQVYNQLIALYKGNGGNSDYVRWKTDSSRTIRQATFEEIDRKFYDENRLTNIIQPLFNSIVLSKKDLKITEAEARSLLEGLFGSLFRTSFEETIEHCGQSGVDGSGSAHPTHYCGNIHANSNCPNKITGVHETFTCSSCCAIVCPGHDVMAGPVVVGTVFCEEGCTHQCSGYSYCGGHTVSLMTLTMEGVYELMYIHFVQPINDLTNQAFKSEEDKKALTTLKAGYELCQAMITLVNHEHGGGLSRDDLEDVIWYESSRPGCAAVVDLALSQLGQGGGGPYWLYAGFTYRVEWCGCFVHWVMNNAGVGHLYALSSNNASVPTLTRWFKDHGQLVTGDYLDLTAGDVIFFDWEPDGAPDHVGIVLGRDDTYIYTVEGNSGDSVRIQRYPINSSVIYGFAPMDYSSLVQE